MAFRNRNYHIISTRTETPLELKRSKVTKDVTDRWYTHFRNFLVNIWCLDKTSRIWNCDETDFNMGSDKGKVTGPSERNINVPHITGGKQRLTVCSLVVQADRWCHLFCLPRTETQVLQPIKWGYWMKWHCFYKERLDGCGTIWKIRKSFWLICWTWPPCCLTARQYKQ